VAARNMFRWILPPIILALAVYPFLPKQENCVLLILEVASDAENVVKQLTSLGNIRHAFRIHSNVFDKGIDTETKDRFNFALITNHVDSREGLAKIEENKCTNVCNNKKFENYHEQLDALSKYYADCKKKIGPAVEAVKKQKDKVAKKEKAKKLSDAKYKAMMDKCKRIAYIMNTYKCKAVTMLDGSCSFYEECWKRAQKKYDDDNVLIRKQEKDM